MRIVLQRKYLFNLIKINKEAKTRKKTTHYILHKQISCVAIILHPNTDKKNFQAFITQLDFNKNNNKSKRPRNNNISIDKTIHLIMIILF